MTNLSDVRTEIETTLKEPIILPFNAANYHVLAIKYNNAELLSLAMELKQVDHIAHSELGNYNIRKIQERMPALAKTFESIRAKMAPIMVALEPERYEVPEDHDILRFA